MKKHELYRTFDKAEKMASMRELKRVIIIFIGYTVALSYVFVHLEDASGFSEIADSVFLAALTSAVFAIANIIIFDWFFKRRKEDKEKLEYIRENIQKAIDKLEKKERDEETK